MRILIAEDDPAFLSGLVEVIRETDHEIITAMTAGDAKSRLAQVDLLITDVRLPGASGLELIGEARQRQPLIEIIVMTGAGSIPDAVDAMRRGARAYLTKPFEPDEILAHIREVAKIASLRSLASQSGRGALVGSSEAMRSVYSAIDLAAASSAPVLVSGPTGSGKEPAARAIHDGSPRSQGPFIAVNLGALPRELVESELFGAESGAYTGQKGRRRGRFAMAHRGSLFLDEINSMPIDLQPKLLRAIETREIWPLGAERAETFDVRIIAATNERLDERVAARTFREDLFYRLNVMSVTMPALDDRPEDLPIIAQTLLDRMIPGGGATVPRMSGPALGALLERRWPGNVRELANVLERAATRARLESPAKPLIVPSHLDVAPSNAVSKLSYKKAKALAAEEWSKRAIREALAHADGNISQAARDLSMSRTALMGLIKRFRLK